MEKPIPMFDRKKAVAAGVWLLASWSACAQIVITNVETVNVTPSGFSVAAAVSPALPSATNVAVSVFSDPGGKTNLAGQVGIELYPLNTGDPTATNSYQGFLSRAILRQDSIALGLIYARVSSCGPNTTYYYQIAVKDTNGQSAVWPASGPLPSATTALENSFVLQAQQMLITLSGGSEPGSIITLSTSNTPSVLAAVVGDGAAPNQIFFNVNDLIAASGDTNYTPVGSHLFTAQVLGPSSSGLTETYDLIFTNTFSVGVASDLSLGALPATISLGTGVMQAGSAASVPISLNSQSALVSLSFTLSFATNLFTAISVQATSPALNAASLTVVSSDTIQLSFTAATGTNLLGNQQIAQLNFTAASNQPSAVVSISPLAPQGSNASPGVLTAFSTVPGSAIIIGPRPVLDMQLVGGSRDLVLYGIPGLSYQIQSSTNLAQPGDWLDFLTVAMTNQTQVFSNVDPTSVATFFRAYVLNADPPILRASPSGSNRSLLAFGLAGTNYTLQVSSNLSATVAWHPLLNYTLTNSFQTLTNLGVSSPAFYRIKKQ
jgi:hypothetical protein